MNDLYCKGVLTVIALMLCLITAKLYLPSFNRIGTHLGGPTRQDLLDARKIKEEELRKEAFYQLKRDVPIVWVEGGDVSVSGSVELNN